MTGSVARNLDRVLIRVVDIDRLDRADRSCARALHPDRHAAAFEMGRDLGHRRLGDETDMRRHALFAAHRRGARSGIKTLGGVEMDLLLAEIERGAAFAHALDPHAEHAPVEFDTAADIGDGQVEMVYAFDLHGRPRRFCELPELATTRTVEPEFRDAIRGPSPLSCQLQSWPSRDRRCTGDTASRAGMLCRQRRRALYHD